MAKKTILILSLFICIIGYANESDSINYAYSTKAESYYNSGKTDSAIAIWKDIVANKEKYNKDIYGTSFYNIAIAYWQKDLNESKKWFLKILESDLQDNDETGSLMEPHTNYKHKSARLLAEIAFQFKQYEESLKWLYKSDTLYPYWGFEGSSTSISKVANNSLGLKCELYNLMNKKEEQVNLIIRELIYFGKMGMFVNEAKDTLNTFILKDSNFIKEFNKALNNITILKKDENNIIVTYIFKNIENKITFTTFKDDFPIHRYWVYTPDISKVDKNFVINYIKNRGFYKQLFLKTEDYKKIKLPHEYQE